MRAPLLRPSEEMEWELVGACIESEKALRTALNILPLKPFRSGHKNFLHGVFYMLVGWLNTGRYNEQDNRKNLMTSMLAGGWPVEYSRRPMLEKDDRALDDVDALAELFCPIPGVQVYIEQLCKEILFSPLVVPAAGQRSGTEH